MHYYIVDTKIREKIGILIALSAVGFVQFTKKQFINEEWYYYIAPTVAIVYGLLFWLFDRFIWKISFINKFIGVPNFSGEWVGTLKREGEEETHLTTLKIHQTFTKISIILNGKTSYSTSISADIKTDNPDVIELRYTYNSAPKNAENASDKYGEGYAKLWYLKDRAEETLKGRYFSMKLKRGTIEFKKDSRR